MNSRLGDIRSAASQMASAAAKAVRSLAKIKSPSRLFMELGDYMGQGLVIGMENETSAAYKAGEGLGERAFSGINDTVSRLGDILGSDLDLDPTIRPVLDLDGIREGARSIDGMLEASIPINALTQAATINRLMNSRIQNGSFNDVVSAIDKLRTGLSELDRTVYQVNGITYDDGSNIATAVGQLVRSARIERRS